MQVHTAMLGSNDLPGLAKNGWMMQSFFLSPTLLVMQLVCCFCVEMQAGHRYISFSVQQNVDEMKLYSLVFLSPWVKCNG